MIATVSNTSALMTALKTAQNGDVIKLQSGDYSTLSLNGLKISGQVTITSASDASPAVLNGINLVNTSGLTFENVKIAYQPALGTAATVNLSMNIRFESVEVAGSAANPVGTGILIRNSQNVTVTDSDIHDTNAGIAHLNSNYLTISNNEIHGMSNDGVRGGGSSNVTITGNYFSDFHPVEYAHNDAIQFWTTNTTTSAENLVITNNTIVRGDTGVAVQGIFMGNELQIPYKNVTISGNAIVGQAYQGINLDNAIGAKVENNFVQAYKDMGSWIQILRSSNVTLSENVATSYIIRDDNSVLSQSDNQTVKAADVGELTFLKYWQTTGELLSGGGVGAPTPSSPPPAPAADAANSSTETAPVGTAGVVVTGTAGNDTLVGTAANDTISGGAGGADLMRGGAGDDTYVVTGWSSKIVEGGAEGTDTVKTALGWYVTDANVENLELTGTAWQRGYGNSGANVITGNAISNTLYGMDGDDTLVSSGGADTLVGGAGADVFMLTKAPTGAPISIADFKRGEDILNLQNLIPKYHGSNPVADGWVKFVSDDASTTVYVDADGPGSASGFTAVAKLNGVTTLNAADCKLADAPAPPAAGAANPIVGTAGNDTLVGAAGNDTISGGAGGADLMKGGAGDDTYVVTGWSSKIVEGVAQGTDTVKTALSWYVTDANVENLELTGTAWQRGYGNSGANFITGNTVSNTLYGMDGDDTLVSVGGADTLVGGAGKDTFLFTKAPATAANITDFVRGEDVLDLNGVLGRYTGTNPVGDGWVKIVSDAGSTTVFVDADGPGQGTGFAAVAKLTGVNSLTASDWIF